jgi:hypothetical protein
VPTKQVGPSGHDGFGTSSCCHIEQRLFCCPADGYMIVRFGRSCSDTSTEHYKTLAFAARPCQQKQLTTCITPTGCPFKQLSCHLQNPSKPEWPGESTCIVQHTTCYTTLGCLSCTSALGDELVAGHLFSRTRYGKSELACGLCLPLSAASIWSGCAIQKPLRPETTCGWCSCAVVLWLMHALWFNSD